MRDMNWRTDIATWRALATPVIIAAALGGAALGLPGSAHAQEPVPKAGSVSSDEEIAKQVLSLIREANAAFEAGDYTLAASKYEQAYALYPDPSILVRLGKTAEKTGDTAGALGYYQEFVRLLPDDPTSAELATTIAELQKTVAVKVEVTSEPSGASIFVDAEVEPADSPTPAVLELTPGTYELRFEKDGFASATETVEVVAGQTPQVSATLTRQMLADTPAANFPSETVEDVDGARLDIYGWTTLGLGVATLATSGVFYGLASSAESDVNNYNKRAPDASRADLQDLKDTANTNYDVSTITAIAGGVLTAVGVGLVSYHYLSATEDDAAPSITWGLDTAGDSTRAWLGINGSF